MFGLGQGILTAQVVLLLGGFVYAAASDWHEREVTDRLWQALGIVGVVLGGVTIAPGGWTPLVLWLVVGAFVLEHMFPWSLGPRFERYEDVLDLAIYAAVVVVVLASVARVGIGAAAVPYAVVAVLASVVFARVLFESGILYGGADAKALMIAGVLVPLFPSPWLLSSSTVRLIAEIFPFSVNLLMDAALLSAAIPLGIVVLNASRGELHGARSFTGYTIPVSELPHRFVWLRDPLFGDARVEEDAIETTEQDRQRRVKAARELAEKGVRRVWVTPQIPYLVLIAAGSVAALLAGNLVVDLVALV